MIGAALAITPSSANASRRAQWEDAIRVRDQFLAVVSHELRAPLAAIMLWERALRQERDDPDLRERALDAIRRSAEQQSRIVEDLLDTARTLSGKLRVELRPTELAPLISRAVDALRLEAGARTLQVDMEEGIAPVAADAGRLQQVLTNLLSNAIKHTDPRGTVTVAVRTAGSAIELVVRDEGRGIHPALLPHLFDPFSQDTAGAGGGLGLGLAVARQLVELHGGEIHAASDGPGRGATFTITLPRAIGENDGAPSRSPRHGRLDGLRILLVDDHSDMLEALARLLRAAGGTIACADSSAAAWRAVTEAPPDVLVSDLAMPGEDGYALLARVRARTPQGSRGVAAVALTAHASARDRARSLAAGFDAHLAKPVEIDELIATIERLGRIAHLG